MTYILYYKKDNTLKITSYNQVIDDLYYQKAELPTKKQVQEYLKRKPSAKIKKYMKKDIDDAIKKIKESISRIDHKIPLYYGYSENLYIINKVNVYNRVVYKHYRFPNQYLLDMFKQKKKELSAKKHTTERLLRKYNKFKLMIKFLDFFDLEILFDTYVRVFYNYANEVGKNITICLRPSFKPHLTHINPYYSRSELINMALNMGIIHESNIYYDQKKLMGLCEKIKKNDIKAHTILDHHTYIIKNDMLGLVQYYSLQGSYFMNTYLRQLVTYKYKNTFLEKNIKAMWKLINNAPSFDKSYILYRFISTDEHLKHLSVGDKYITPSFTSTTRDPFYRSDEYKFGFILIKIHLPKNKKGVALCMETISHFPKEQEIILAPSSILRLDKKDSNAKYYHTDNIFAEKIKTRYEFTYIGKEKSVDFVDRPIFSDDFVVDFLNINKEESLTIKERIKYFIYKYAMPFYQYKTKIGNKDYTIICEWYNSTGVYKNFYAANNNNGFAMYTIIDNFVSFTMEIGEDHSGPYMFVNYYFRHSQINKNNPIKDKDFIYFISTLAHYFEIDKVLIFADYTSCDVISNSANGYGGNYCTDIYNYYKSGKKRYSDFDSVILKPKFSHYHLDRLKKINIKKIVTRHDENELYQIYKSEYKDKNKDLANFYVWLIDNFCASVKDLVKKFDKIFTLDDNPFNEFNNYYILDAGGYLYNNHFIDQLPVL